MTLGSESQLIWIIPVVFIFDRSVNASDDSFNDVNDSIYILSISLVNNSREKWTNCHNRCYYCHEPPKRILNEIWQSWLWCRRQMARDWATKIYFRFRRNFWRLLLASIIDRVCFLSSVVVYEVWRWTVWSQSHLDQNRLNTPNVPDS